MFVISNAVAWFLGRHNRRPETSFADIQRYMYKVVNAEEAESRYNLTRAMLHDAKRRTMPRDDAREPARISRMRIRRSDRHVPLAGNS